MAKSYQGQVRGVREAGFCRGQGWSLEVYGEQRAGSMCSALPHSGTQDKVRAAEGAATPRPSLSQGFRLPMACHWSSHRRSVQDRNTVLVP